MLWIHTLRTCLLSVLVHSALYQCLRNCRLTLCPNIPSCAPCSLSSSISTKNIRLFPSNTMRSFQVWPVWDFFHLFRAVPFFMCDKAWNDSASLDYCLAFQCVCVCVNVRVSVNSSGIWGWEMWVKCWSVGFWCMSGSAQLLLWPPAATSASASLLQNISAALLSSLAIGFLL